MSRMPLMSLIALTLVACSGSAESEVSTSQLGRSASGPTPSWSAPPGEGDPAPMAVLAPSPVHGPEAPVAFAGDGDGDGVSRSGTGSVEDLVDGEGDPLLEIEIRPGESLVLLSQWSGLSVEAIAEANGLRTGATLYPGQLLEVDLDVETFAAMQDTRDRFEDARLDRYLTRRGTLVGVTTHTVGTGETAWQIAREHGELPLWVVASFNRGRNLDRLRIGDELNLPMLGDTVVMDDAPFEEVVPVAEVVDGVPAVTPPEEGAISTNP